MKHKPSRLPDTPLCWYSQVLALPFYIRSEMKISDLNEAFVFLSLKGKGEAEAAVLKDFPTSSLVLKPGIIAGAPPGELRPPGNVDISSSVGLLYSHSLTH